MGKRKKTSRANLGVALFFGPVTLCLWGGRDVDELPRRQSMKSFKVFNCKFRGWSWHILGIARNMAVSACLRRRSVGFLRTDIWFWWMITRHNNLFVFAAGKEPSTDDSVKLLVFLLHPKPSWEDHVGSVCRRLSRGICWVSLSPSYLLGVHYSLFNDRLSYGLLLWGHSSNTNYILVLQKVIRIIADWKISALSSLTCKRWLWQISLFMTADSLYVKMLH